MPTKCDDMTSVLIGCEYSATERDAFRRHGLDAWSCDLKPTDGDPRWHMRCDILDAIQSRQRWGLIVLHVDCTAMAVAGNRHYGRGKPLHRKRLAAVAWTLAAVALAREHAASVVLENPASVIFPLLRERGALVQYVQPYQHGHPEQKKTGLALWGVPPLRPTHDVHAEMMLLPKHKRERVFYMSPSPDRGHERSRAYQGIADAMAGQWAPQINP